MASEKARINPKTAAPVTPVRPKATATVAGAYLLALTILDNGNSKTQGQSDSRPRQDSNLRTRLRRPVLYPLSYEGEQKKCSSGL